MTIYHVHIYRELRLMFEGIEAESPDAAAAMARDKLTSEADETDDCDGITLAALVDEAGDSEYKRSVVIDFDEERLRKAAPALLAACSAALSRIAEIYWDTFDSRMDNDPLVILLRAAIASADAAAPKREA